MVGLPISRESASVSQAQAQNISPSGLISVSSTAILPPLEAQPLRQPVTASPAPDFPSGIAPADSGQGEYNPPNVPDITDRQRQAIQGEIEGIIERLGKQSPKGLAAPATSFSWPLQAAKGLTDYGYHGVGAFVDHNAANPNQLQDWFCGTRTYDLSGYNHQGTDIFLWPFKWNKMDQDQVEVIAAAPGTLLLKHDGNFDRNCAANSDPWNGVYIQHADGSVAWYVHLKKGSVTSKPVGSAVNRGEYLGVVGSSGGSTGPHLHFEVHDAGGQVIDPYAGPCNNISSWWIAQRPYYDSAVNSLTTGDAPPVFPSCPNPETSNSKDQFNPGETVYFTTYYRDLLSSQQSLFTVYQPDGTVYRSWSYTPSSSHSSSSYSWHSYTLEAGVPSGLWKFQAIFNGQTYEHTFSVGKKVYLQGRAADRTIHLDWKIYGDLPPTSTWQIAYDGPPGVQAPPVTGLGIPREPTP